MLRLPVLALLAGSALAAQAPERTVFASLPAGTRVLETGASRTGRLTTADGELPDGGPRAQAWLFVPTPGAMVTIDLLSDDFDAMLVVVGPGIDDLLRNDDGAGRCNSRITHTFTGGEYRVIVTSFGFGRADTGAFTLRASTTPPPVEDEPCDMLGDMNLDYGEGDAWENDVTVDALNALPATGRVARGDSVTGTLSASAAEIGGGRRGLAYMVTGSPGSAVTMDLASTDFDAYLYVVHPTHSEPLSDDDSGGSCNARLTVTLPESGEIRVVATSFGGGAEGTFLLGAYRTPPAARQGSCGTTSRFDQAAINALDAVGRIAVGQTREGELTSDARRMDAYYADIWEIAGRAGDRAVIELRSTEFDAYLGLTGPGLSMALTDDDGAGQCNSRIDVTFPESGVYRIIATTFRDGATGLYTLVVGREPAAEAEGGCAVGRESGRRLNALPVSGALAVGSPVNAGLEDGLPRLGGGSLARAYTLDVRAGDVYTVRLVSPEFDAFLYAVTPDGTVLDDDDCGGGTDAQLVLQPAAAGRWRIVASSYSPASGAFTLTVGAGAPDDECGSGVWNFDEEGVDYDQAPVLRQLQVGDEYRGALGPDDARHYDGTHFQAFDVMGRAGQRATIDLVSDVFDAYLLVIGRGLPDGLRDDDSGGACNSRITLTFPESGTYRIIVNTIASEQGGPFVLRVSAVEPPGATGPCRLP